MRFLLGLLLSTCLWIHMPSIVSAQSQKVEINVSGGTMQYDTRFFVVKPGSQVTLILKNSDLMPHNLVICSPGKEVGTQVQQAAWQMGEDGMANHYIPKDKRVLHATKIAQPGKNETISFKAPSKKDDYPFICTFPGHVTMRGIMRVSDDLNQKPPKMKTPGHDGHAGHNHDKGMKDRLPYAYRTIIAGVSPQTICVGSPQGLHYAFNPETCTLAKVWTGEFLDVKKDQHGRGGAGSKIKGKTFYDGGKKFPLAINGKTPGKAVYRGYRLSDEGFPTFMYMVDGVMIHHHISPDEAGKRLSQQFHTNAKGKTTISYTADKPDQMDSQSGAFKQGKLTVTSSNHIHFEVGVKP